MFVIDLGRGEIRAGLVTLGHACFIVQACLEAGVGRYSTPYSVEPLSVSSYGKKELLCYVCWLKLVAYFRLLE